MNQSNDATNKLVKQIKTLQQLVNQLQKQGIEATIVKKTIFS